MTPHDQETLEMLRFFMNGYLAMALLGAIGFGATGAYYTLRFIVRLSKGE